MVQACTTNVRLLPTIREFRIVGVYQHRFVMSNGFLDRESNDLLDTESKHLLDKDSDDLLDMESMLILDTSSPTKRGAYFPYVETDEQPITAY